MNEAIARHCRELDRCNQRGGRMLSVFDLLDAKTLDLDLAAYPTMCWYLTRAIIKRLSQK
jgi:hypothetical protein